MDTEVTYEITDDQLVVTVNPATQAVILAIGDGTAYTVDDDCAPGDELDLTPIQRAVWAARLHAVADTIGGTL